jgi:hypothetical protein
MGVFCKPVPTGCEFHHTTTLLLAAQAIGQFQAFGRSMVVQFCRTHETSAVGALSA